MKKRSLESGGTGLFISTCSNSNLSFDIKRYVFLEVFNLKIQIENPQPSNNLCKQKKIWKKLNRKYYIEFINVIDKLRLFPPLHTYLLSLRKFTNLKPIPTATIKYLTTFIAVTFYEIAKNDHNQTVQKNKYHIVVNLINHLINTNNRKIKETIVILSIVKISLDKKENQTVHQNHQYSCLIKIAIGQTDKTNRYGYFS